MPSQVDLRLLRPLVALAQELHFGRAAQELALSQPALTQQIQRLEKQSGLRLFDRSSSGVQLTREGRRLAQTATDALAAVDGSIAELTARASDTPLRLGHTPLAAAWGVALQDAAREAGALGVVGSAWEDDLMIDLRTGRHAAIIGHAIPGAPDLQTYRLAADPLHVVANGLDETATEVHLLDLCDRELLLGPSELQPSWRTFLLTAVADGMGQRPRVRTVAMSTPAARSMPAELNAGGFTLMPASYLPDQTQSLPVVPAITAPVTLAWSSASIRPDLQRTVAILKNRAARPSAHAALSTRAAAK